MPKKNYYDYDEVQAAATGNFLRASPCGEGFIKMSEYNRWKLYLLYA